MVDSTAPLGVRWLIASTRIETPSVSDSRMNSWRLSVHVCPTSVRKRIAVIHSASVSSTSRTNSCRCRISALITVLKRGSSHSASRSITASVRVCSLN
jgi:hypothetical protein